MDIDADGLYRCAWCGAIELTEDRAAAHERLHSDPVWRMFRAMCRVVARTNWAAWKTRKGLPLTQPELDALARIGVTVEAMKEGTQWMKRHGN